MANALAAIGSCPAEEELLALVAGTLHGPQLQRIELHTADCPDCRLLLMAARDALSSERTSAPRLRAGAVLNQRYRVVRELGAGGMGVVYEADDLLLGQRVALKALRADWAWDPRAVDYLKSEVRLARRIGHAHVCRVYDLGSHVLDDGPLEYLTMELLSGPSLRALMRAGLLPVSRVLGLATQLLAALSAAHQAGVLHRDFKPDNVLLRNSAQARDWHAVVTDFGLARAFPAGQHHLVASRALVGSAAYLAPEQVDSSPLTEATDIYSFGVVLFELLTGRLPFVANTAMATAIQRLTRAAPRPSAVRDGLEPRFDAFVLRCLARDPTQRFRSAEACRAALLPLVETAPRSRVARALAPTLCGLAVGACATSVWWSTVAPACPVPAHVGTASELVAPVASAHSTPTQARNHSLIHDVGSVSPLPAAETGPVKPAGPKRRVRPPSPAEPAARAQAAPESAQPSPRLRLRSDGFIDPFAR